MTNLKKKKILLDAAIVILCCGWTGAVWLLNLDGRMVQVSVLVTVLVAGVVLIDVLKLMGETESRMAFEETAAAGFQAYELVLLNEDDKPIRGWDLTGKTAMIIGRKSRDEDVDVDLNDCEYSALINIQHAVLNYCLDSWYLEDLGSQNGIQIEKAEDGRRYQVAPNRPCKVSAGDVIYIAKTKLLFT